MPDIISFPPWLVALWLGILTSISPCPLASNIAAVCYMTGSDGNLAQKNVITKGLLYALGRTFAYMSLTWCIAANALAIAPVANFLQAHMNMLIGPVLIVAGVFMAGWIRLPGVSIIKDSKAQEFAQKAGNFGALALGFLFAMSFCPVSAGLFFGSLIPIIITNQKTMLMAGIYGAGTAIPVIAASVAISIGMDMTQRFFLVTKDIGIWAKRVTSAIFILTGVYYSYSSYSLLFS